MATVRIPYPIHSAAEEVHTFSAAFVISLILTSVPIKNFAYIAPVVYLVFQLLRGHLALVARVIAVVLLVALISILSLHLDSASIQVNPAGVMLALLTYLPMIIVVCHPPIQSFSDQDIAWLQTTCAGFVIVQSVIGLLQFAISRNPDTVCGTFGLLDFLVDSVTIAQVYFTFTLFSMILFMCLDARRQLIKVAIGIGLVACMLAQSGHQTIFLVATLAGFALIRITRPKFVIMSLAGIMVMAVLALTLYPETIRLASDWSEKVVDENSPKRMAVEAGFTVLDDPKNLLLGTGLGQFSSRAALITSDEYLTVRLPEMLVGKSDYYIRYIEPASGQFEEHGEGSAISKPYFSLLSIVVETGLLGSLVALALVGFHFFRNVTFMRNRDRWVSLCGTMANVGLVFFVLCCTVENYAEFAQAIFLPILLYIAATSRAQAMVREQASAEGPSR